MPTCWFPTGGVAERMHLSLPDERMLGSGVVPLLYARSGKVAILLRFVPMSAIFAGGEESLPSTHVIDSKAP